MVSDWKETLRLRIVEGHRLSGKRLPVTLLDNNFPSTDASLVGVEGLRAVGEGGVEGLFLSAERDLFGNNCDVDADVVLVRFGDGHLRVPDGVAGVGDLYLELTSLVVERLVVAAVAALFFSARTSGGLTLGLSAALLFLDACPDSQSSIHPN